MITNLDLSTSGRNKFEQFMEFAKPGINREAVLQEMLGILHDRLDAGETLTYELGKLYTLSGNPAHITLNVDDLIVEYADDE